MNARKIAAGLLVALAAMNGAVASSHAQYLTVYTPTTYIAPGYTGTVQVVNNSGEMLSVMLDGVVIGTAQLGLNNFPNVVAGYHVIQLTNAFGMVRSVGRLFLAANGSHTWTVGMAQMMIPTVTVYQPVNVLALGAVQVENRTPAAANVFIGGRMYGSIQPGQTAVYYSVPSGNQEIVAYNQFVSGQVLSRQNINVTPGVRQYVMLMPQYGVVRVINSRAEAIQITIDNGRSTWIQPGQSMDLSNVDVGARSLVAIVNGQNVQQTSAPIYAGQTYAWYVRATTGTIRIINRIPETVQLVINGVNQGQLLPGQERYFQNIDVGRRMLVASDMRGVQRANANIDLAAGETRLWVVGQ